MRVRAGLASFLGLLGAALALGFTDREIYGTYDGFALPEEVVLPDEERHPSLWFSSPETEKMREKRAADETGAAYWAEILENEFVLAVLPAVPRLGDDKKTIHKYYGTLTQIAAYNGFLYQISEGDDKDAYLEKAVEALKRGYEGPLYEMDPIIKGSAVDEIYQGIWAQNFAAAYDWVQPELSSDEDALIRGHLIRHAEYMYENLWSWADSPHNHLSKPAWGLGSLALCLSSEENAAAWLKRAVAAANANTRYFFSGDGLYREGSHYYIFSLINFLPFLYHYSNTAEIAAFSYYQPAFEWPIRTRNGKGWMWNFEDSFIRPYPSHLAVKAFLESKTHLHSSATLAQVLQWNADTTDLAAFDAAEKESGFNYTGASWDYPKELIEFICYQPGVKGVQPDVDPVQLLDSGQTVFRSDWNFGDADTRTLVFHGVAEADNHEHYDLLSFVLHAENQMMSSDAGYTRKSYGEPARKEWYLTDAAHNVVTFNGKGPVDPSANLAPFSSHRLSAPNFACEIKEAPFESGGSHRRLVALLNGERFAIGDFVTAPESGEIGIVMHGGRADLNREDALSVWSYQKDRYGEASQLRQWFWGKGFETEELEGELTYIKGDYAPFPYLKHVTHAKDALALSVLDPIQDQGSGIDYRYEQKSDETVVVSDDAVTEWLVLNASGDAISEGDWQTDALFAWVHSETDGQLEVGAIACRTFELAGTVDLAFNGPVTFALSQNESGTVLHFTAADPVQGVARVDGQVQRLELSGSSVVNLQ